MLFYLLFPLPSLGNKFQQSVVRNVIKLNVSNGGTGAYKELSQLSNPSTIICPMRHEGEVQLMGTKRQSALGSVLRTCSFSPPDTEAGI